MNKGTNDLVWIISSVFIIMLTAFVLVFFVQAKIDIHLDYPETSAQIGSYSLLQNLISEDCLGTDISGVLSSSKISSKPADLDCISDPSFSYFARVDYDSTSKEFTDIQNANAKFFNSVTAEYKTPILVKLDSGELRNGNLTLLTTYKNREFLVFLRECAEEALITGECKRVFISDEFFKITLDGDTICKEDQPEDEKACLTISGEFHDDELDFSAVSVHREEDSIPNIQVTMKLEGTKVRMERDFIA